MNAAAVPPPPPRRLRRLLRWVLRSLGAFALLVGLYVALGFGLAAIPVAGAPPEPGTPIEIAIFTSPVHTDLVVPVRTDAIDWRAWLPAGAFTGATGHFTHVSFGWGDRGFYLETPNWSDLKVMTALTAVSGLGATAVHVEFHPPPRSYSNTPEFRMTHASVGPQQYRRLVEFLQQSFQRDAAGGPLPIAARGYWYDGRDAFFEARGSYSLFRTCNTWTCEGLQVAGLPVPWWSPFPGAVTQHLPAAR